jgi:hypothetical protein
MKDEAYLLERVLNTPPRLASQLASINQLDRCDWWVGGLGVLWEATSLALTRKGGVSYPSTVHRSPNASVTKSPKSV